MIKSCCFLFLGEGGKRGFLRTLTAEVNSTVGLAKLVLCKVLIYLFFFHVNVCDEIHQLSLLAKSGKMIPLRSKNCTLLKTKRSGTK